MGSTKEKQLSRLIYVSRAASQLDFAALNAILLRSEENNFRNGITGALAYGNGYFLQILEGHREAIEATYNRILRDKRHSAIRLLEFCDCDSRHFDGWAMKHLGIQKSVLLAASGRKRFEPKKLNAEECLKLLLAVDSLCNAA